MRIVSWNVNGIRSVLDKGRLQELLDRLSPDILCLQEIKAMPEDADGFWAAGYHAVWNPAQKKGYSGTLTLSRTPPLAHRIGIGEPEGDAEGRVVTTEYEDFILVNCYTPNSKDTLQRLAYRERTWDPAFRRHLQALAARKPTYACGDLNVAHREIDLARPAENRRSAGFTDEERRGFEALMQAGFVDTFRARHPDLAHRYTWWSYRGGARERNVGWRIDYFICSADAHAFCREAAIHDDHLGSDHCPVSVELDFGRHA